MIQYGIRNGLLLALLAFAGGIVFEQMVRPALSIAAVTDKAQPSGSMKEFYDQNGARRLDIGVWDGVPLEDLYGEDGKLRLQFGMYGAGEEKGLPLVGFSDNQGDLKLLLRLAGANQSPVMIFKDNHHQDRIVMGLALNDPSEEPFLAYFDKSGQKHMVFGEY